MTSWADLSWVNVVAAAVVLACSLSFRRLTWRERFVGVACGAFNLWVATL